MTTVLTLKAEVFLLYIQFNRMTPIHNLLIPQILLKERRQIVKGHSPSSPSVRHHGMSRSDALATATGWNSDLTARQLSCPPSVQLGLHLYMH